MAEMARFSDYFQIQGGKPTILQDSQGLWHIKHLYREDSPEIITHISPKERGLVKLSDGKIYEVAYLWNFEGKPCETESIISGGNLYKRDTTVINK